MRCKSVIKFVSVAVLVITAITIIPNQSLADKANKRFVIPRLLSFEIPGPDWVPVTRSGVLNQYVPRPNVVLFNEKIDSIIRLKVWKEKDLSLVEVLEGLTDKLPQFEVIRRMQTINGLLVGVGIEVLLKETNKRFIFEVRFLPNSKREVVLISICQSKVSDERFDIPLISDFNTVVTSAIIPK